MRILMILLCAVALTACRFVDAGGDESGAKAERVTRSPGKPLHPIQVRAEIDGAVRAGAETDARLVVSSSRPAEAVEVILQPELPTVLSASRFERRDGELLRGRPTVLPFSFRPASDAPQPIRVLVRVTGLDGRVMTREVTLSLSDQEKVRPDARKPRNVDVPPPAKPADDVVVPAEQEVRRDD